MENFAQAEARKVRSVREAVPADYGSMRTLYGAVIAASESAHHSQVPTDLEFEKWLDSALLNPLVIFDEARVLGWGLVLRFHQRAAYAPTAEVYVCVDPTERRNHYGSSLLRSVLAGVAQPQLGITSTVCMSWGPPWLQLWLARYGFETAGVIQLGLSDAVEAAHIMQRFV